MFINHLKIAFRNLWNNRFFTILNLSGLAIGIAVSLALMLYVKDEISFDKYHEKGSHIYRVGVDISYEDVSMKLANAPNISGPTFKEEIIEVEEQARFLKHNFGRTAFVSIGDKNFAEEKLFWADPSVLQLFDVPLLEGDPSMVLDGPNKIILSESSAKKMFPYESPIGKRMKLDNEIDLEITGIFKDFPTNSSFDCEIIGSFKTMKWAADNLYWSNCSFETFLLLHPEADQQSVAGKITEVLDKYVPKEEQWFSFWLQPFHDIHLRSESIETGYTVRQSNISQVRVLGILAIAVLLLACFNYINMTTARSQQRFREVGINKTLGASTGQMVRRFYIETGLLVLSAMVLGVLLVEVSLPLFESVSGRALSVGILLNSQWVLALPVIWLLVTFGAGLYPALFLSSFSPKKLLQPLQTGATGNHFFRQTLVVGQFTVCVALIIGAIVFDQQLNFIGNKNLGYQSEQVVAITTSAAEKKEQIEGLMNKYRSIPAVKSLVRAQAFPGLESSGYSMNRPGQEEKVVSVQSNRTGTGFEEVLGINLLSGKTLPEKSREDTTIQVVMNETGVKFLGWTPEEAIGKTPPNLFGDELTTIVGVAEDFHFESLHKPIQPYVFTNANNKGWRPFLLVKMESSNLKATMQQLENGFKNAIPSSAFEFVFLDDHMNAKYGNEKRLSRVVLVFTLLTIFISCLGLFGLAAFMAERRTKEIGIRKVLGASVGGLVSLLAKDFMKPVLISILLAAPIAYIGMNLWLQDFAYRINMQWWYLVLAGAGALLIAFATVSFQSMKSALANPINSLRSE